MRLPRLETDRLIIRGYTAGDLETRHRLNHECFGSSQSIEETRSWLMWNVAGYTEFERLYQPPYGDYAVALKESGVVVGSVGIVPAGVPWGVFSNEHPAGDPARLLVSPEFGLFWAVLPEFQGNGYASEAAHPLIQHLFTRMNMKRVVATTEHTNTASQRVMEKLGMTLLRNPTNEPFWFEVVGVIEHPLLGHHD